MDEVDPCSPSPCGSNAICKKRNGAGSCICMQNYYGDPYIGCRPECIQNTDCPTDKACFNTKCENPCVGTCSINAECRVINHVPVCSCVAGYMGDPLVNCYRKPEISKRSESILNYVVRSYRVESACLIILNLLFSIPPRLSSLLFNHHN